MNQNIRMNGSYPFIIVMLLLLGILHRPHTMAGNSIEQDTQYRGIISVIPQYLGVNGLRLDYDMAITNNHWIQAGPVLFLSEDPSSTTSPLGNTYVRQTGAGLHLYHRYYPGNGFKNSAVYISYGGMWHYNHITYNEEQVNFREEKFSTINKVGADVIIGVYAIAAQRVVIDVYTGMGLRYSTLTSDASKPIKYNSSYTSPGYSGNILILGLRIGFTTLPRLKNK